MNSMLVQDRVNFLRRDIIFKFPSQSTQVQHMVYEKNRLIVSIIYHILV